MKTKKKPKIKVKYKYEPNKEALDGGLKILADDFRKRSKEIKNKSKK